MEHLDLILTIVLLGLAFILKLSVARPVDVPDIIQALVELPVDIIFLAISFGVAFTIAEKNNTGKGLFYSFVFIFLAVIVVMLWRLSIKFFTQKSRKWIVVFMINVGISCLCLFQSTKVLLRTDTKTNNSISLEIKNK